MSVRNGLLALLASQEMYGAQLRSEFEARTGGQWPLNIGQVYTTLGRLERDGLVEGAGAADDEGRIPYRLTETGRGEVDSWWAQAVPRDVTPRNELAIKLALAVTMPGSTCVRSSRRNAPRRCGTYASSTGRNRAAHRARRALRRPTSSSSNRSSSPTRPSCAGSTTSRSGWLAADVVRGPHGSRGGSAWRGVDVEVLRRARLSADAVARARCRFAPPVRGRPDALGRR